MLIYSSLGNQEGMERLAQMAEEMGRNNVAFCTNISCWLNGAEDLVAHAEKKLGCRSAFTGPVPALAAR